MSELGTALNNKALHPTANPLYAVRGQTAAAMSLVVRNVHPNQGNPMNKPFFQCFLLTVALIISISVPAKAQSLWGDTTSGMNPSQVIEVVKGSRLAQDGDTLGTGARELIRLDDLNVVNELFDVRFYFLEQSLTQVTLGLNDERSFSSTLLVFDSLADALRSKYGKEMSESIDSRSILKKAEANWVTSRTNINLLVLSVGNSPAILNLNYQIRLSEEADKL